MFSLLVLAATMAPATAAFAMDARSFPPYRAPGQNDVRSPCPGLNSLANHGFIPRSGKGMTVPILIKGLKDGLNVGFDFASTVGQTGEASSPDGVGPTFDLDNLDEHNFPLEHDASLSRQDYYFGNDHSFNQTIFNQVLNYYIGMDEATIPIASKARYARVLASKADNPTMVYGPRAFILSYGETALYLSTMGDPISGIAPVKYVKSLFEEERLPYEQGWRKPMTTVTLQTLGNMITRLYAANPEALPEGLSVGTGSLRDVLALKDPLTGKAANLTCITAGLC